MANAYLPINFPLSGAVTQTFFPTYFTVNVGQSSNPDLEPDVLTIASYGKQLGRIEEALTVLLNCCQWDFAKLGKKERDALLDFQTMVREINKRKARRGSQDLVEPQFALRALPAD